MTTKLKPSSRSKKRRASKAKKRSKKSFAQITTLCKQIHLEQLWSDLIKDDAVRADLNFQSRVRWPESNRKSYMTSLLLRMAPSKFIFASTESCKVASKSQKDIEYYDEWGGLKVQFLNIDSNNRVTTIKGFMNDEFGLQSGIYNIGGVTIEVVEGKNDTYSNLDGIIKSTLMTAPITIEIITQATRKQLSDQFIRMNDGVYLNGPEKRNAIISDFSTVIRDLATKYEKILSVYLTPSQVGRRGVDDFIAGVAFVSMHGSGVKITDKTLWAAYNENSQESEMVFAFESDFDKFMSVMKPYVNLVNKNSILDLIVIWKEQINQTRLLDDVEGFFKHFGKVHASLLNDPTLYEVSKMFKETFNIIK